MTKRSLVIGLAECLLWVVSQFEFLAVHLAITALRRLASATTFGCRRAFSIWSCVGRFPAHLRHLAVARMAHYL